MLQVHDAEAQRDRRQSHATRLLLHTRDDAIRHRHGLGRVGLAQQQHELIAAMAAGHIVRAQHLLHASRHQAQCGVASGVTHVVVHLLEVVDVEDHQRGAARRVDGDDAAGEFGKVAPVGHLGERVHVGQRAQAAARIAQLALGAVEHESDGDEGHHHHCDTGADAAQRQAGHGFECGQCPHHGAKGRRSQHAAEHAQRSAVAPGGAAEHEARDVQMHSERSTCGRQRVGPAVGRPQQLADEHDEGRSKADGEVDAFTSGQAEARVKAPHANETEQGPLQEQPFGEDVHDAEVRTERGERQASGHGPHRSQPQVPAGVAAARPAEGRERTGHRTQHAGSEPQHLLRCIHDARHCAGQPCALRCGGRRRLQLDATGGQVLQRGARRRNAAHDDLLSTIAAGRIAEPRRHKPMQPRHAAPGRTPHP